MSGKSDIKRLQRHRSRLEQVAAAEHPLTPACRRFSTSHAHASATTGHPGQKQPNGRLRSAILAALFLTAARAGGGAGMRRRFRRLETGNGDRSQAAGVGAIGLDALEDATIDDKVLTRDRARGVFSKTSSNSNAHDLGLPAEARCRPSEEICRCLCSAIRSSVSRRRHHRVLALETDFGPCKAISIR